MRLFCILFFVASFLFHTSAQDKVILLNGDTLDAWIPSDPYRETKLSHRSLGNKNDYGYARIAVFYKPDSVRIHTPEQIHGYWRKTPGRYLGNGFFISNQISLSSIGYNRNPNSRWVFRHRVSWHPHLSIWYYHENDGEATPDSFFFIERGKGQPVKVVENYNDWKRWSAKHPPFDAITQQIDLPSFKRTRGALYDYFIKVGKAFNVLYPY
jgi:hypothetical protein